jgi:hypothetical protein
VILRMTPRDPGGNGGFMSSLEGRFPLVSEVRFVTALGELAVGAGRRTWLTIALRPC